MPEPISGLLLLDKPEGPTSFDCVKRARDILRPKRIGHCGTLDPMAQGVLVLLFGNYTRRQDEFLTMEKQYWFRGEFGRFTDSGDRTGKTLESAPTEHLTRDSLDAACQKFLGEQQQTPPRVSAIKYQGKPLYEWARKGIEVPRTPRPIRITSFDVLAFDEKFWEARVVCSRGTYIRTLVEDVARALGSAATVDALIRERVGTYRREDALSWEKMCSSSREELLKLTYA